MVTVFTSGCFDILHAGHVQFLECARGLGDRLIVGLNTDESIRLLKGPERPWNPLAERMAILQALRCVDVVIPFDRDTPRLLIHAIHPDIVVKGAGYEYDRILEWIDLPSGCRKYILPGPDLSTTKLINRIRGNGSYP